MKYPCFDGVDRDDAIEEFLSKEARLEEINNSIKELELERYQLQINLGKILTNKLGLVGYVAIQNRGNL